LPSSKLGDYIGTMHLAMHLSFRISMKTFLTLALRAYVTYYQAQGLSGHTSPCGEYVCVLKDCTFYKSKVGTIHREKKYFSQEHHAFFEQPASSTSILINYLLSWSKYHCNCLGDFHANRRCQALLIEEAQDGFLHHNTRCSGTSCGGINPYTLTARLGPGGLAHYETSPRLDPTVWSFAQGNKM